MGLGTGILLAAVLAVSCMIGVASGSGEGWPIVGDFLRSYEIERAERDGRLTEVPASVIMKIVTTDELEVGDCYTKLPSAKKLEVALLLCDQPSAEGEVQALIRIPDGPYPGPDALFEVARSECPSTTVAYLEPTELKWSHGDRVMICLRLLNGRVPDA